MKADMQQTDSEPWTAPDAEFTPEERAALNELGWKEGRGQFDPNWKPLPKRPKWLAFIYRTLRIGEDDLP